MNRTSKTSSTIVVPRRVLERLRVHVSGDQTTVTGRVTGDFPGSPVDLQYRFTLEGDKIARLEIAP